MGPETFAGSGATHTRRAVDRAGVRFHRNLRSDSLIGFIHERAVLFPACSRADFPLGCKREM